MSENERKLIFAWKSRGNKNELLGLRVSGSSMIRLRENAPGHERNKAVPNERNVNRVIM
jgi:hypothetical protein